MVELLEEHLIIALFELQPHLQLSILLDHLLDIEVQLLHLPVLQIQLFACLLQLLDNIVHKYTGISTLESTICSLP